MRKPYDIYLGKVTVHDGEFAPEFEFACLTSPPLNYKKNPPDLTLRGEYTFWDVRAFVKSVLVISDTYLSWDIELLDLQ